MARFGVFFVFAKIKFLRISSPLLCQEINHCYVEIQHKFFPGNYFQPNIPTKMYVTVKNTQAGRITVICVCQ